MSDSPRAKRQRVVEDDDDDEAEPEAEAEDDVRDEVIDNEEQPVSEDEGEDLMENIEA
jgi:hypothetical protein